MIKLLGSCGPRHVRAPGSGVSSECCGTGCRVHTQVLLRATAQTGRNTQHWSGGVCGSLDPAGPSYSRYWDRCCGFLTYDSMILGVLEYLGVQLPLGVVGLGAEVATKVI